MAPWLSCNSPRRAACLLGKQTISLRHSLLQNSIPCVQSDTQGQAAGGALGAQLHVYASTVVCVTALVATCVVLG